MSHESIEASSNCLNNPVNFHDAEGTSAATIIVGFMQILGAALGGMLGQLMIVLLLNKLNPGYKSDYLKSAAQGLIVGLLGGGIGNIFSANAADAAIYSKSLGELSKTLMRSLMQTGLRTAARSGGIGFAVGFMFGVYAGLLEFFMSETYSDNWGEAFGN